MSPSIESRDSRLFASEVKFLIDRSLAESVRAWARAKMLPDPNAGGAAGDTYRITSLYLDTPDLLVYRKSASFKRCKYRVRRYDASDMAFLERKLKTRALLTKRRSCVGLDELPLLAEDEPARDWAGTWFHRRLLARRLAPVCQVSYQRTARVAQGSLGPIRLTLDEIVRASAARGFAFTDPEEGKVIGGDDVILELKYLCAMPALFKDLVAEFRLNARARSKYRQTVKALGLSPVEGASPVIVVGHGERSAPELPLSVLDASVYA